MSTVCPADFHSATGQHIRRSSFLSEPTPSPVLSNVQLEPNQVVVQLTTSLVIPNYARFYDTPIQQFQPTYFSLDDGSVVTKAFMDDLANANRNLLFTGILTMLFARNLFVSGDYIRRAKVKRKILFYVLFVSQLLACVSLVPSIVSEFDLSTNCALVHIMSYLCAAISEALLITWILGFKAYKCLDNSIFVLVSLASFLCGSFVAVVLDLRALQVERRLTGSCVRTSTLRFIEIYIILQLCESLFICCCFLYAVWNSRRCPIARGRISLQLSMDTREQCCQDDNCSEKVQERRGWWDYVPKQEPASAVQQKPTESAGFIQALLSLLRGWHMEKRHPCSKPLVSGPPPKLQPPPVSTIRISEPPVGTHLERSAIAVAPAPSILSFRRLSRYMPRMELFRDVMKDELGYTTFITASCVVAAVLVVIGLNFENGLSVTGWIAMNWAIISLLAIHSFGRVVRRHERDAVLQEPVAWQTVGQTVSPDGSRLQVQRQRSSSTTSPTQRYPRARSEDPFSETRGLQARSSWNSGVTTSSYGSDLPSPVRSIVRESPDIPVSLPSLLIDEFPSSGRTTPLVLHDSSLTGDSGFRRSWLDERASISNSAGHLSVDDKGNIL